MFISLEKYANWKSSVYVVWESRSWYMFGKYILGHKHSQHAFRNWFKSREVKKVQTMNLNGNGFPCEQQQQQ